MPVPVSILTGFLGAGKTTLLNGLLRHPQLAHTAVLINEIGETGLDHLLVEPVGGDVVLFEGGCICCAFRDDVGQALQRLMPRIRSGAVRRVIIETTGLADPAPLVFALTSSAETASAFRLDSIVAVVDALHGADNLAREYECAQQAAMADRIVISKSDLAGPAQCAALETQLMRLNRGAAIHRAAAVLADPGLIFNAGLYDAAAGRVDVPRWLRCAPAAEASPLHASGIASHALVRAAPIDWADFAARIESFMAGHGEQVLRTKGILNLAGEARPCVIHGVKRYFHPPAILDRWPERDPRSSRLVMLARGLGRALIAEALGFA